MPGIVILGLQWGDEGKGKIVDYLAKNADCIVRYNGGANAGHTVMINGEKYKFHLIPSGALQKKKLFLGNGVVIDPEILLKEIKLLKERGIEIELMVSEKAHIVFDFHKILDALEEKFKGKFAAETTMKGIGPAYSDKVARFGIRAIDLLDEDVLRIKLEKLIEMKQKIISNVYNSNEVIDKNTLLKKYIEYGKKISKYVGDVSSNVNDALDSGKIVIFEGAQGTLLDIDHGVYPFGTSSNSTVGGALTGVGVGPLKIKEVIGVAKAYTSRVGAGPLPTELKDELGEKIRKKGGEYGTTTGRPRRIGWFDAVCVKYAAKINGITSLAITKLDVLGGIDPVKICIKYDYNGKIIETLPSSLKVFEKCMPIYEEFDGWEDFSNEEWLRMAKKGYDALPKEAIRYLKRIEKIVKVPIALISIGSDRSSTICIKKIFSD